LTFGGCASTWSVYKLSTVKGQTGHLWGGILLLNCIKFHFEFFPADENVIGLVEQKSSEETRDVAIILYVQLLSPPQL
jgi:hypothetical protein